MISVKTGEKRSLDDNTAAEDSNDKVKKTKKLYFISNQNIDKLEFMCIAPAVLVSGVTKVLKGRFIHSAFKPQLKIQF